MAIWLDIKKWYDKTFPLIPDALIHTYGLDTQTINLKRLVFLSSAFVAAALVLFIIRPSQEMYQLQASNRLYYYLQALLLFLSVIALICGMWFSRRIGFIPAALSRSIIIIYAFLLISWSDWMAITKPFHEMEDWFFFGTVFLVFGVLYLSFKELMILSGMLIISQYLMPQLASGLGFSSSPGRIIYLGILGVAFCVSRIIYYARIHNYLNWENISRINATLKQEVNMHLKTTEELEDIRQGLDRKVHQQTRHLRDANQRLSEEIAERRYADKVRGILYRISTFVNRNFDLPEVLEFVHQQLSSIMDVTNFFVGLYHKTSAEIEPVFQLNSQEKFERYRIGHSLSSYVIRHQRAVLLDHSEVLALADRGEVELGGIPASSWLGVPLLVEAKVVGILIVQSYKPSLVYDKTDQELLEYVSEHLASAIARNQAETKLISAKEKAEEADRLKSAFLANLSHEIRTPMNAIMGFAELIGLPELSEKDREYYSDQVVENSTFLLTLISNIIELSKIQSGEIFLKPEIRQVSVAVNEMLPSIKSKLKTLRKDHLYFRTDFETGSSDLNFVADPDRYRQVMSCLLENAIKFTEEGGIELGVRQFDRSRIQFSIRDTGIGMDAEETIKIFEWFRQGNKASQELYRGMGLGLTLAKILIQQMGGDIWVETELGSGSCFYFTLPSSVQVPTFDLTNTATKANGSDSAKSQANAG